MHDALFWGILVACPHLGLTENPEGGLIPSEPYLPFPWFFVLFPSVGKGRVTHSASNNRIYLKEKPPPRNFIEKHCWKGLKWVKSSIMQCWYFLIDLILTRIRYILQLLKRIDILPVLKTPLRIWTIITYCRLLLAGSGRILWASSLEGSAPW